MAASTTPPSTESVGRIAVAYSGGRDSSALLHATARMAADMGGIQVVALHVHHGLSPHADAWLDHAKAQCARWAQQGLPVCLEWRLLALARFAGQSLEAVARKARYQALSEMARQAECALILLAHHRQDQAETVLLQALRGAGVAGLAAMPHEAVRQGVRWLRPWLSQPRSSIEAYVAQHGIHHVDDDSNLDRLHARNLLRLDVWPALSGAFRHAEASLAQAASHQADVLDCLNAWLCHTLPRITCLEEGPPMRQALLVSAWRVLSDGQQRQVLRAWFAQVTGHALPMTWVVRLHDQAHTSGRWPIRLCGQAGESLDGEIVLYRGRLNWQEASAVCEPRHAAWPEEGWPVSILDVGRVAVPPAGGVLIVTRVGQGGVALSRLARCQLKRRGGGEQFQLAPGRPARSLKKQFQAKAVPAWDREGPLLWAGSELLFVPALGLDARILAGAGEDQVLLRWEAMGGQDELPEKPLNRRLDESL